MWLARLACGSSTPYGDACFNQLQMPVLTAELEAAAAKVVSPEVKQHLLSVAGLAKRARQTHTYLWLIGN